MSIRFSCPSCEAPLTVDDEKAGKKVRCRKCEGVITVPAASSKRKGEEEAAIQEKRTVSAGGGSKKKREEEETAVQEKRKLRVKSRARDDDDDEDDDNRSIKKKKKAKSGMPVMALALGGGGLAVLLLGGGLLAWLLMGKSKEVAKADAPAKKIPEIAFLKKDDANVGEAVKAPPKENSKPADVNTGKPLPDALGLDNVQRVKAATLYMRVTMGDNNRATGTGFLAMEPGLVVTNAHVVGMLARNAPPPKDVEAILHSGQPNELILKAKLIAVDRLSDLAFLRVDNPNLPAFLRVDAERKMVETQKVWIFGFPKGESLGKEITVSDSSVSSFRRDARTRELSRIQVNGGMQPGNSGGPVVNSLGDVIGVAVSGFQGTQLNFAVPGERVVQAMDGRVSEARLGQAYVDNNQLKMPIKLVCIDPLRKISQVKVDVWTGLPGPTRGYSLQQPAGQAGDGARQTHTVTYDGSIGTLDVPLPQPNPGQVCWVQPVVTNTKGSYWAPALATQTELYAIERKPGNLTINLDAHKLRTVKFKSSEGFIGIKDDEEKTLLASKFELDILEELMPTQPAGDKTRVRTSYGSNVKISREFGGQSIPIKPSVIELFRQWPPGYSIDKTNKMVERSNLRLSSTVDPKDRFEVQNLQGQLYNSIEAITLPMPNKQVQPHESWIVKMPFLSPSPDPKRFKDELIDLVINCTYQGVRTRDSRTEGIITLSGNGQRRGKVSSFTGAEVTGRVGFDSGAGFISFAQVRISNNNAGSAPDGSDIAQTLDIEIDRKAGNPLSIPMPKDLPAAVVAKGKVLLNSTGVLGMPGNLAIPSPNPLLAGKNVPAIATLPQKLQAGKTYVITLDSNQFDAYLILQDATGKVVAEDDDGGATPTNPFNARIEFRCTVSGSYRILLTTHDGKGGQFQFKVQEAQ